LDRARYAGGRGVAVRVLIAVAEQRLARIIGRGLQEEGYSTEVALDGESALVMVRATRPDRVARQAGETSMRLSRGISRWSLLARAVSMCALLVASALPMAGGVDEAGAQPKSTLQAKPEGEMRWALYVTLSPVWFDPGEFQGLNYGGYPDIDALYKER